jgi:hypothetical protein
MKYAWRRSFPTRLPQLATKQTPFDGAESFPAGSFDPERPSITI